jgi:hypothetical protein
MLFDLRRRGRRRTIQGIYLALAILMGGGLIFFGVGGTGVGLFNSDNGGGGGGGPSDAQIRAAEKRVRATPRDPAAWAQLAQQRFIVAGQGTNFDERANTFTAHGKQELRRVEEAWDHYLALHPRQPDVNLARIMFNVFAPSGLNRPARAVGALEIVTAAQPSAQAFAQLAVAAYQARQARKGDLAAGEAVRRAPKATRQTLKTQLAQARAQALSGQAGAGAGTSPSG